jgi:hypothetical protein
MLLNVHQLFFQWRGCVETAAVESLAHKEAEEGRFEKGPYTGGRWVRLALCVGPHVMGTPPVLWVPCGKICPSRPEIIPSFAAFVVREGCYIPSAVTRINQIHFRHDRCRTLDRPHT